MEIYSKINFHNYPDNSRVEEKVVTRDPVGKLKSFYKINI